MGRTLTNTQEKFWQNVIEQPNGCWYFQGLEIKGGYMLFSHKLAHRISYELFKGKIPDGLTIDHLCNKTNCVNPGHLEAVTQKINNLRSNNISGVNARKTHCPKGHEYSNINTVIYSGARRCLICKKERAYQWRRNNGANVRTFKQKKTSRESNLS
jgi:hypothetical protein